MNFWNVREAVCNVNHRKRNRRVPRQGCIYELLVAARSNRSARKCDFSYGVISVVYGFSSRSDHHPTELLLGVLQESGVADQVVLVGC